MTTTKTTKTAILGTDLRLTVDGREIGRIFATSGRFNPARVSGAGYEPVCRLSFRDTTAAARFLARRLGAELEVSR